MLKNAYEACLAHELMKRGLSVARQLAMPGVHDGAELDVGYRLDLLVEKCVIVEVKAVELLMHIHQAQLMTYLRMSGLRLGFVINFNVKLIRDGIKRIVVKPSVLSLCSSCASW